MARALQDAQATPHTTQASTVTLILTNSPKTTDVPIPSTPFEIYPKDLDDGIYLAVQSTKISHRN